MLTRRTFLASSAAAAGTLLVPTVRAQSSDANSAIGLGFVGTGWRGGQLLDHFARQQGIEIVALCDADEARVGEAAAKFPGAAKYTDMRQLLENDDVDAVVIATCNHWHCLAAIWACQAGKDVYVEKPLGHNMWEQEQLMRTAAAHNRIVQVGTQQRSSPIQAKAKQFLHEDHGIGKLERVVVSRIGERKSIGKHDSPIEIPASVDFDLWLGPAQAQEIYRDQLHYDWHWDYNTGNGEMGNWGVHVVDDVINVALQDRPGFPTAVHAAGTRAVWDDAGNSPNIHVAHFENSELPVTMILSNIVPADKLTEAAHNQGYATGYTVFGEGGRYCGQRGGGAAYDNDGKLIKEFSGSSGDLHVQAFLDAVRSRDEAKIPAPLKIGHISTGWCHLACIAALEGKANQEPTGGAAPEAWSDVLAGYQKFVAGVDSDANVQTAGRIDVDAQSGEVAKLESSDAQQLVKRTYRSPQWEEYFNV